MTSKNQSLKKYISDVFLFHCMTIHFQNTKHSSEESVPAWTTACVCADVPEAMLVNAHAASNWSDGLAPTQTTHSQTDLH